MAKRNITKNRTDLSEWILHFVHDRENDQRPKYVIEGGCEDDREDGEEEDR